MSTVILQYCGIEIEVEYTVTGEYDPGTRLDPPEYPEYELLGVVGVRLVNEARLLRDLEDELTEQIGADLED